MAFNIEVRTGDENVGIKLEMRHVVGTFLDLSQT